jgi:hypothetical protein
MAKWEPKSIFRYSLLELNERLELSVKSSKESIETINLLKTRNKVVEVGWVNNKVEDNNSMRRGPSGKQIGYHYLTPKVPWLCFSKNTEKLPPWRPEKGHAKKNLFLEIQL